MSTDKILVRAAAEAADRVVPFSGSLVSAFLSEALDVQDEQLARLSQIEEGIERLIEGPGKAGRLKLEELRIPNRRAEDVQRLLDGAADDFFQAMSLQEHGTPSMAQACLDPAEVRALQSDGEAMRHYAWKAYHHARVAMLCETALSTKNRSPYMLKDRRGKLGPLCQWYVRLELRSNALGDPETDRSPLRDPQGRGLVVDWRPGAWLDYYYIKVRHDGLPGYERPQTLDTKGNWGGGNLGLMDAGNFPIWYEFKHLPEAVIAEDLPPWMTKQRLCFEPAD